MKLAEVTIAVYVNDDAFDDDNVGVDAIDDACERVDATAGELARIVRRALGSTVATACKVYVDGVEYGSDGVPVSPIGRDPLVDEILADYAIGEQNRGKVERLVAKFGKDAARTILTGVHGTPEQIAAGNGHRVIIGGPPRNRAQDRKALGQ